MADITVIIPAYNARTTIGRALQSLAAQTCSVGQVLVVDDASTDDTVEAAEQSAPHLALAVLPLAENGGPATARQRGIDATTSEFIGFLDADDEWHP
ncbi:glycosyltransferase family 2 protein [Gemmatimonas sp.]|uniref:glycosyltransferase family 2 protein n=1 Tax=Gemmatimonas sp. TaxID=1962908 RepID=UPI0035684EAD